MAIIPLTTRNLTPTMTSLRDTDKKSRPVFIAVFFTVTALSLMTNGAIAGPQLHGNMKATECAEALSFAKYAFYSSGFNLYDPPTISDHFESNMVLGTIKRNISAEGTLVTNANVFTEIAKIPDEQAIYWEKQPIGRTRLVIREQSSQWEGFSYTGYVIRKTESEAEFVKYLDKCDIRPHGCVPSLFRETWRPPFVFKGKANSKLWLIKVGDPDQALGSWAVLAQSGNRYKNECLITFGVPSDNNYSYLPPYVRQLARLVDDTLGAGMGEGSYHPTAEIRQEASKTWANALFRPWAITDSDRYNSKTEVDIGLAEWSEITPWNQRLYRRILAIYPRAERELSLYYTTHLKLNSGDADSLAKYALKIAFCANYAFPNGGQYFRYNNVDNNPWLTIKHQTFNHGNGVHYRNATL